MKAGTNELIQRLLLWHNSKDDVPTIEEMQKTIAFYQNKEIGMVKLVCILPNLAKIYQHKSTDAEFYSFTEADKGQLEKIREDVVGCAPIVSTREAVVEKTFIRKSAIPSKSNVGIDASQLYL